MSKLTASLSLDLDNLWSYMRTHGDAGWERYPSYIPELVPIVLGMLWDRGLCITVFIVGKDAAEPAHAQALSRIVRDGHEVGNHSMNHLQWLHKLPEAEIEREIAEAEESIERATGARPRGFRGPGFACSERVLSLLRRRGYAYDCSMFPTFLGPLARAYYFRSARGLSAQEAAKRKDLFGGARDVLRPIAPYTWRLDGGDLLEIPVTTLPYLRIPFHLSYVLYLARFSRAAALAYLKTALALCRASGTEPSFLLHPLDFLSFETCPELGFFPAMDLPQRRKLDLVSDVLDLFLTHFDPVGTGEHARRLLERGGLPSRVPDLG